MWGTVHGGQESVVLHKESSKASEPLPPLHAPKYRSEEPKGRVRALDPWAGTQALHKWSTLQGNRNQERPLDAWPTERSNLPGGSDLVDEPIEIVLPVVVDHDLPDEPRPIQYRNLGTQGLPQSTLDLRHPGCLGL